MSADAKENVVMTAGECEVTILPRYGGKISSILFHGHELLQQPLRPIAPRTQRMSFEESDASGWDECLPSVSACAVRYSDGVAHVPDHGDLWRTEWECGERWRGDGSEHILTKARCFSLPLELERKIGLYPSSSGGATLRLEYSLRNVGDAPSRWAWSAHPLFAVEEGDKVLLNLPADVRELRLEGSSGKRLGHYGDVVHWPIARVGAAGEADLRVVQAANSGIGDKLFAGPLKEKQFGGCGLVREKAGVSLDVTFDLAQTPYLGLWLCYGGWPAGDGPKQMCVALEPATAPVDSLAVEGAWSRVLAPGEQCQWWMWVGIQPIVNYPLL